MGHFIALAAFLVAGFFVNGQIAFTDVTTAANLDYTGESWGAAWGDADGDGWPDLFCSNHYRQNRPNNKYPSIYLNQGDGTFLEKSLGDFGNDIHGAAWVDFNNDGAQELIVGSGPNKPTYAVFHSGYGNFGVLDYKVGLGEPGRSSQQLILDADNDGRSDLVVLRGAPEGPGQEYTKLYWNNGQRLMKFSDATGFDIDEACILGTLMDVDGDNNSEMVLALNKKRVTVYDQEQIPFLPYEIDNQGRIADFITGDFNGDLMTDLLILYHEARSHVGKLGENHLSAVLYPEMSDEGINFVASLPLKLDFYHGSGDTYDFLSGGAPNELDTTYTGTYFSTIIDSYPQGIRPHIPGVSDGIYLGYDSLTSWWTLHYSSSYRTLGLRADFSSLSGDTIDLTVAHGFDPNTPPSGAKFLVNTGGDGSTSFADVTASRGVSFETFARAGVAGDFDNDMDLDIYLATSGGIPNRPNVLLENQGDGTFAELALAGGAGGSTTGLTDIATAVDFDNDGFLDLYVNNGATGMAPGPDQLFRNLGNANHYLEVLLQGTISSRDAGGAVVYLYAGGKAQVRTQKSGAQRNGQSHQRLHFGLGPNLFADSMTIHWPSGIVETRYGIAADQIMTAWESSASSRQYISPPKVSVEVSPNPASDFLKFSLSGVSADLFYCELYASNGRLLKAQSLRSGELLPIADLPDGEIQLRIFNEQGEYIASKRVVKL